MYAFQIVYDFPVHGCQFLIDPDSTVTFCLFTSFCIRAGRTDLSFIYLFLSAIVVAFHMATILKPECFPVWTSYDSIRADLEVHCTERVFVILLIRSFLLEHRKLHVLSTRQCKMHSTGSSFQKEPRNLSVDNIPRLLSFSIMFFKFSDSHIRRGDFSFSSVFFRKFGRYKELC